jgi:hypothetical protein
MVATSIFTPDGGDAVHDEGVAGLLVELGGLQQRLGGDAADVEAGAAEAHFALGVGIGFRLDAGRGQAELRGTDRRHVAAGTAADHHYVELLVCHVNSFYKRGRGKREGRRGKSVGAPTLPSSPFSLP